MAKPEEKPGREGAAKPAARAGLRVPLGRKFAFFIGLMVMVIMAVIGVFVTVQQNRDLGYEVRERGATIARGLASDASEAIVPLDTLQLAVLVSQAVQSGPKEAVAAPAASSGGLAGRARALWKDVLEAFSRPATVGNEGVLEAQVVGTDGTILADSVLSKNGTPYQRPDYLPSGQDDSAYPLYEQDGRVLYDISEPIRSKLVDRPLGTVHLAMDRGVIRRVVRSATIKLAAITLGALVFGILLSSLVVSWLVRPMGRLRQGVLAIAGGDFDQQINIKSRDELGALTDAFNEMSKNLSQKRALMGAFSRYVSSDVMNEVLSDEAKDGVRSRRVEATVYFSDVRGFTAMSETMQPEQVVNVINEYLGTQSILIEKYGGQVNKYVGDATMALFGLREGESSHPLMAVKAALRIQEALSKLNRQRERRGEIAKQIGIGINTGDMVVGNLGGGQKLEYTAIGDNVTLSDNLCAVCEGGGVLVSEGTYEKVRDEVRVE